MCQYFQIGSKILSLKDLSLPATKIHAQKWITITIFPLVNQNWKEMQGTKPRKWTRLNFFQDEIAAWLSEEMFRAEIDIDQLDTAGNTPLHLAARDGRLSTVSVLIQSGSQVGVKVSRGRFRGLHDEIIGFSSQSLEWHGTETLRLRATGKEEGLRRVSPLVPKFPWSLPRDASSQGTSQLSKVREQWAKITLQVRFHFKHSQNHISNCVLFLFQRCDVSGQKIGQRKGRDVPRVGSNVRVNDGTAQQHDHGDPSALPGKQYTQEKRNQTNERSVREITLNLNSHQSPH